MKMEDLFILVFFKNGLVLTGGTRESSLCCSSTASSCFHWSCADVWVSFYVCIQSCVLRDPEIMYICEIADDFL